jgi:bifunctional non-homologous end joining protein LigD
VQKPGRYTTVADVTNRVGKLFIDCLRNGRGYTAVGAYSPRARQGFGVAMPVTWKDIESGLAPQAFTLAGKRRQ